MSHTKKDLERAAEAADSNAAACIEESQQLHGHAEQTQVYPELLFELASCPFSVLLYRLLSCMLSQRGVRCPGTGNSF
jgi:hypothetical protein